MLNMESFLNYGSFSVLYNAVKISDCMSLLVCLQKDELGRIWRRVVVYSRCGLGVWLGGGGGKEDCGNLGVASFPPKIQTGYLLNTSQSVTTTLACLDMFP